MTPLVTMMSALTTPIITIVPIITMGYIVIHHTYHEEK